MSRFEIRPDDPTRSEVADLIARHLELMHAHSPACSVHALDADTLSGPDTDFFSLSGTGRLLAIGALRRMGDGSGEIKSMHTLVEARGSGAGAAMVTHLMEHARAHGLTRLDLETGSTDNFAAARRLYARHGFRECGPFGTYAEDPLSTFMTRAL